MTKPGAMRWNSVLSKYPAFARETIDADAFGAVFRFRATANEPQFVSNVSDHFFDVSRVAVGFFSCGGLRGCGAATWRQPPGVNALCVCVLACVSLSDFPPH